MANTALRIAELDFGAIKENLKDYLRGQSEFTDFDFEGPGISVLLDILAYNTHYMGYYLNMVGNESFLDTAQIRSSVVSHAKSIGYTPLSKSGAQTLVDITVTPSSSESNTATSLTLDKYTRFLGQDIDGVNYPFVATNANTVLKSNSSFVFSNVTLRQGEVVTHQYLMDSSNEKRRFEIPSANVDTSTLLVTVQQSSTNTDSKVYTLSTDITELTSNSRVFFVEENENQNYTLVFGDGILGKRPDNGSIINCTYVDTVGRNANGISRFGATTRIGGLYRDNVIVSAQSSTYGGTEKETLDQIRYRAPRNYVTQNRAVTKTDYETLILQDFPNVRAVSVWGGEDNDPVVYGKVYMSLKTDANYALTSAEKEHIKDALIRTRNVLTVTPEIIDPDYVYGQIFAKVYYNQNLTTKTSSEIEELVRAAIFDYNNLELSSFTTTFRKSKLQSYIEAADPAITGSDVSIFMQKRVLLDPTLSKKYEIKFGMPIKKGTYSSKIHSFPELYINDATGVERQMFFEEVLDAPSGINSIEMTSYGSGFTETPTITITGDGTKANATATIVGGKLTSINIVSKGQDYTEAEVAISGGGSTATGATAVARLENDYGTIRSFYYKSNGEKFIVRTTAGNINYSTGLVELISLRTRGSVDNDFYGANTLTVFAPAANEVITPLRNRIIVIDENDGKSVNIEMIAE